MQQPPKRSERSKWHFMDPPDRNNGSHAQRAYQISPLLRAPIRHPSTCQTNIQALQVIQNKALCVRTGSPKMADQQHPTPKQRPSRLGSTLTFSASNIRKAPSAKTILLTNSTPLTLALAQGCECILCNQDSYQTYSTF